MDEKEKNVAAAEAAGMPDLAFYMQSVTEQLEKDKKRPAVHTYTYTLKSVTEFYGGEGTPMPVDEAGRGENENLRKRNDKAMFPVTEKNIDPELLIQIIPSPQ